MKKTLLLGQFLFVLTSLFAQVSINGIVGYWPFKVFDNGNTVKAVKKIILQ